MHRFIPILSVLLAGCGTIATEGPPGPQGIPGDPGEIGPPGADGAPAVWAGARLTPYCLTGEDGSGICDGRFTDGERGEVCRFGLVGIGEPAVERCLPPITDRTGFGGWVTPDCSEQPAGVAPGTLTRLLTDGSLWEQTSEVEAVWVLAGNQCVLWDNPEDKKLYLWEPVPPAAFVLGTAE